MKKYMDNLLKIKLGFFFACVLAGGLASAAQPSLSVNLDDKKDIHDLMLAGEKTGQVIVKTTFVEEPVISPLRIEVSIKCAAGYQQKKLQTAQSWKAFDYGTQKERKLLSSFNKQSQEVVVYFWDAKMDDDGAQAIHDRMATKVFLLKDACVKSAK